MASDGTLKFDTSLDTEGLQSGMGKVASVAQQALGVFTGQMMTRAVDALANLGKSALSSVGQLEQNIGGVETLFDGAADAVIASADRAYQTAGMSANEYMSTVTSFSASLLQSLGGNTEEAAKVADMAIIDMADNANKMGTSMDMIQNAYQGFAKQNYTMLDNLKLGYGGTKTEMERLLADAEKLTGVKYDINNLNDVYQAIHAVQEEMGITGTTAKEAASTLEGSLSSAKAAWDNFMNGSSDADQLADAFGTAADNIVKNLAEIIPRFAETLPALAEAVVVQIPDLVAAIVPAILSAGQSILEKVQDAIMNFDFVAVADKIVQMITDFIDNDGAAQFLTTAGNIITALIDGIAQAIPKLLPVLVRLATYIVTSLIQQVPKLLQAGIDLVGGIIQGVIQSIPAIGQAILDIGQAILDAFKSFFGIASPSTVMAEQGNFLVEGVIGALKALPGKVADILSNVLSDVINWGGQMLTDASNAMNDMLSAIESIVLELPGKVWTHLINTVNRVITWGQQMVTKAGTAMSDMLSKVVDVIRKLPGRVWGYLSQAAGKVVTWGVDLAKKGAVAAGKLFDAVIDGLKTLPDKIRDIGDDIVTGLWNGINSGWDWLTNKVKNLARDLLDSAKDALGIDSPSTEFRDEVGRWLPPGIGEGFEKAMPQTIKDLKAQAGRMVSQMQAAVSASAGTMSINAVGSMNLRALPVGGTVINNDNHFEQKNTYNVPVATPSEVSRTQREALRNMVGGVK